SRAYRSAITRSVSARAKWRSRCLRPPLDETVIKHLSKKQGRDGQAGFFSGLQIDVTGSLAAERGDQEVCREHLNAAQRALGADHALVGRSLRLVISAVEQSIPAIALCLVELSSHGLATGFEILDSADQVVADFLERPDSAVSSKRHDATSLKLRRFGDFITMPCNGLRRA